MANASIHKLKLMIRKTEARGYRVMYLPLYSPKLNPIEQFGTLVKGKMKPHRLMKEETLTSRILKCIAYGSFTFEATAKYSIIIPRNQNDIDYLQLLKSNCNSEFEVISAAI